LKPELQSIATAMGLNADATVLTLQKSIQKQLRDHPELADDPRFLPLYAHRTVPKAAGKNSGDKAAEDASQTAIPTPDVTGYVSI
jgi:hypothetical protein